MPTYDYFCQKCDHQFTEILRVADREDPKKQPCPNCGENEIEIQICAPALASPIVLGIRKPPQEFKERMSEIKKNLKNDPAANIKDY